VRRLLLFLIMLVIPAIAQTRHPFTFEDMMKLKRVGEPEVSPNGKWVIFSVVDVDLASNKKTPHIWIVPLDHVGADVSSAQVERSSAASPERILISDQDADRPRWAPDGKRFAFISTKDGGSQVWIADFDETGGTVLRVHKLTSIATEADGELWSPDGKNILFKSDVYPECDGQPETEAACNAKKVEEVKNSKVKAMIFTQLLYRHWDAFREGKRTHLLIVPVDACVGTAAPGCPAGAARDLTPGDFDAPVFSLGGQDDYAFSPDGKEICYVSNHDKNPAASTNNDLWIVPVYVGADVSSAQVIAQTKNITGDNPASDSSPLYSPDGKYIAYRAQFRPGDESDRFRLMLYDRTNGEKKNLTEGFDRWVNTFAWTPNSKAIYFTTDDAGEAHIYVWGIDPSFGPAAAESGALKHLPGTRQPMDNSTHRMGGYRDDILLSRDGKTVVFTKMSITAPTEIYSLATSMKMPCNLRERGEPQPGDCKLPEAKALTHLNDSVLSQVSMSPLEPFWFTGAHNDNVEGFLVKPPNFDPNKKYPLKFVIHGGPEVPIGDEWTYRWNSELFAADGYVVIEINFHGSPGYGQKFVDAINGDWGGAPYEDLMKGLDYAEQHFPFIDKDRECALGASYGGYMIDWILGHTDRFKCLVSHDGQFNTESAWGSTEELWFPEWEFKGQLYDKRDEYRKWSPHVYAKNFKTPTLVVHGQLDYRLDVSEGFQLFTTLQMLGVPSKMLYFPDEGHWVLKPQNSQLWYKTVNDWIDQWTKSKPESNQK